MESGIYLNWDQEFFDLDLGDERLNRRFVTVLDDISRHPGRSLYAACETSAKSKAAYRLMDHEHFEPENVWQAHREQVIERMRSEEVVLLLQDTTSCNFEHLSTADLGR